MAIARRSGPCAQSLPPGARARSDQRGGAGFAGRHGPRRRDVRPGRLSRGERLCMLTLVAAHAGLALWGAAMSSVTFDENFHVPAGVAEVARGDFLTSAMNPPLVKALFGAAALTAGARLPADSAIARVEQSIVGESFMRRNADRYHR